MREKRKSNYDIMTNIIEENKEKLIIKGGNFNSGTARKGGKAED